METFDTFTESLSPEERENLIAELEVKAMKVMAEMEQYRLDNKIEFFTLPVEQDGLPANPPQQRLLEAWLDPTKKVFTYTGGNRIGKTTIGVIIAISVMVGYWLWNRKPIKFPHTRPRKVRYVGQGWESHIKAVLEPALREWFPKNRKVTTRKNNQGVDYLWKDDATHSTLEIMSNSQDSEMFEGWMGDLVVYDEPPHREIRVACARGLIDRKGRELFCMTLLKEAWIHREVIKGKNPDGTVDTSVFNINGDIQDNVGFGLTQEGVDQFAKTLKPEEKEARLRGKPSYMSTLVCPKFDRNVHVRDRFKIPLDWIIDISIDFHPSKPWGVVFLATARNNFKYVCDEILDRGNPKYITEEILRRISERPYNRINSIIIDPLAKGGEDNDIDVFSIVSDTLASHGLLLETASKDKEVGISILNDLIWTENEMPGIFLFKDCINTITQVEDWMYDPETLKPSKVDDDFCECLYRLCLRNTQWLPDYTGQESTATVLL